MKYALITGASTGIGFELAKVFGYNGYSLIIVSSNHKRLLEAKEYLERVCLADVHEIAMDLSEYKAAEELYEKTREITEKIDVLINNAGFGLIGPFDETDIEREEKMLSLNVITVTKLTRLFYGDMKKKNEGIILNVASTGAFQPGPYTASYYASKSYVLNYSKAIMEEARDTNVQISVLCPGSTDTAFFEKTGRKKPLIRMKPEKVAKITYRRLLDGKQIIIPGFANRTMLKLPARLKVKAISRIKK